MSEKSSGFRKRAVRIGAFVAVAAISFGVGALLFRAAVPSHHVDKNAEPAHVDSVKAKTIWTCSMHPQIQRHEPGQCPICGMDLIEVQTDGPEPGGKESIVWSERARVLAKIRTLKVERLQSPKSDIRLLGRVEPAETALKTITSWIGGRIDKLHVKVTGQTIKAGQVVATLYSPEIYAAHQDLLVAKRQVEQLRQANEMTRLAAEATLAAAREKLRLLGVPQSEINWMEQQNQPRTQVPIRSPFGGTVMERLATEGTYVSMGAPLYSVANLYSLWIQLDAYENDLGAIASGQQVRLEAEALPQEEFTGRVSFIDPSIDPIRRTARVRVEVPNPKRRLLPGMFVEAVIAGSAPTQGNFPLVIPVSAPLFTGRRSIVYVEVPETERPTYEARVVRLGPKLGVNYPVVSGLTEGERVVVHGAFVIDADLQIRGGDSMMSEPDDSQVDSSAQPIPLVSKERAKLRPLLEAYLELQERLAADDLQGARRAAKKLEAAVLEIAFVNPQAAKELWSTAAVSLETQAKKAGGAESLEAARGPFELLSNQIQLLMLRLGNPLEHNVYLALCPMAFDNRGAHWLQKEEVIDNPYFGDQMRTCGEIKAKIEPGQYLPAPRDQELPTAAAVVEHLH